jgi:hypothetical protein
MNRMTSSARLLIVVTCAYGFTPAHAYAKPRPSRVHDEHEEVPVQPVRAPESKRKVGVAYFEAADEQLGKSTRAAVLESLGAHPDIEVVSPADYEVTARRLGVDARVPQSRAKLAQDLGLVAWLDGRVDEDGAHLTLTAPDGRVMAQAEAKAKSAARLPALSSERMWATMGPYLSDAEARRVLLQIEGESARKKLEARSEEAERQKRLASAQRWPERAASRPVQGWNTPHGREPVGPSGVSAATQRWLEQQRQKGLIAPSAPAAPTAPSAGVQGAAVSGNSPATQRWLAQQGAH